MESLYIDKGNEHIYYPQNRRGKLLGALIFIFCMVMPVFCITFANVFEIAAMSGVGGFFVFLLIGAAITFTLYRVLDHDIKCISVYQSSLRLYMKNGDELFYPLNSYAGYTSECVSRKTNMMCYMLWFEGGDERAGVEIGCLSDEQRGALVKDIETFLKIDRCDRAVAAAMSGGNRVRSKADPVLPKTPRSHPPQYLNKKTDPAAYREYLKNIAAKIGLNDRIHLTKMLKESRKIEAVRLIQKITGLGLAEARDLAEYNADLIWVGAMPQNPEPQAPMADYEERKANKAAYREYMKHKAELIDWQKRSQARTLIEQGRKIEAIKLVREAVGLGLAEARDMVEEHSDLL